MLSEAKVLLLTVTFSGDPQLMKKLSEAEEMCEEQRTVKTHKAKSFRFTIANEEQRNHQKINEAEDN